MPVSPAHAQRRSPSPMAVAPPIGRWLPLVTGLFVTVLIISNIVAVKLVSIGPLVVTAAIVLFPISYIVADVLTEVYGYAVARRTIWIGFLCNLVAVLAIMLGGLLPPASFWQQQGVRGDSRLLGAPARGVVCGVPGRRVSERLRAC